MACARRVWQFMPMQRSRPLIGVIADRRPVGHHPFHMAGEKYLRAVADCAEGFPVILPCFPDSFDVLEGLDRLDGLLLTGSTSDVEPCHYRGPPSEPGAQHDPARDTTALALIPATIRAGLPLLAICRGFQEINVALGGTLHRAVHEQPGFSVHHENADDPVSVQYGPAHEVRFTPGGLLAGLTGSDRAMVNSVHHQGVDRLADGLDIEATAPDGLIEGFVVRDAPGFTPAVQWHPEWQAIDNALSTAIFRAFGEACRRYRE
jgi:putative glutamine amidotransferase